MIHEYAYYYIQVADYNRILYLMNEIQFNSMKAAKYLNGKYIIEYYHLFQRESIFY